MNSSKKKRSSENFLEKIQKLKKKWENSTHITSLPTPAANFILCRLDSLKMKSNKNFLMDNFSYQQCSLSWKINFHLGILKILTFEVGDCLAQTVSEL